MQCSGIHRSIGVHISKEFVSEKIKDEVLVKDQKDAFKVFLCDLGVCSFCSFHVLLPTIENIICFCRISSKKKSGKQRKHNGRQGKLAKRPLKKWMRKRKLHMRT
ncbi:uncharacterized protein LOC131222420 isoform X1 [Magnolia sinica]|uniref:uncharacterized protein LOC131222420 isoform X1 n=1 Tax=Magnolia sinica TaxID=86752 RepID=UPI00265A361B|nr:uncharacterized protein LOC131222420 isoform X1 [Magnolia sinica]